MSGAERRRLGSGHLGAELLDERIERDERVIVDGVQRVRAGITVTPHEIAIETAAAPK